LSKIYAICPWHVFPTVQVDQSEKLLLFFQVVSAFVEHMVFYVCSLRSLGIFFIKH